MSKEHALIKRIKEHDEKALQEVYEGNRQAFIDFAFRFKLSKEDVLDVYQDAMIAFCEQCRKGHLDNLQSSISTYIFAVGKYKIYALLKKEKQEISLDQLSKDIIDWDAEMQEPDEETQILQHAFLKLGHRCRQVLTLFYYEGKKLDEIQKIMGYEHKDVLKSQKSRCLKQLKELSLKK